ncbi:CHASE2 domain-containing protein [Candidatus Latescibacterota bacterium]
MFGLSDKQKRFVIDVIVATAVLGLMIVLFAAGVFQSLDWKLFDTYMNVRRSTPVRSEDVVVVCIDEKSLSYFQGMQNDWPWPREFYGYLAQHLSDWGAKAVVFDIIFSDPDFKNASSDAAFSDAIAESGITYLMASANRDDLEENPVNDSIYLTDTGHLDQYNIGSYESAVYPIHDFSQGAKRIGLATAEQEADGIFRRYMLALKVKGKYIPSMGFAVAGDVLGESRIGNMLWDDSGESSLIDRDGKLLLNWYGKSHPDKGVFKYYSFHGVIASMVDDDEGKEPLIAPDTFKDKVIIVGSNAEGLMDLKATPFSSENDPYPGMEIHATAIQNFLNDDFIQRMPAWVVIILMITGSVGMFVLFKLIKGVRLFVLLFALCLVSEIAVAYWLLESNIWMNWIEVFSATTFTFAGLVITGYFSESKDKKIMRRTFQRYVSETVLERIFENPDVVDFEGRSINATVMATDIQGFTSISETLPAHEVVSRLNDYLSEVSEMLIDNGAFINKYIGDAILAVFGAFGDKEHQRRACIAGIAAMQIIERKIIEAEELELIPFITRMGVTTGDLTIGNIGSQRKIEFTVIGDTVNSAFRLEGINKYYNTRFLISEFTKEGVGDDFEFRLIDSLKFKGKDLPVRVYEVLGQNGSVPRERLRQRDVYEDALAFYTEGKFAHALEKFNTLTAQGDAAAEVMKLRCEDFINKNPGPEWKGVWTMFSK